MLLEVFEVISSLFHGWRFFVRTLLSLNENPHVKAYSLVFLSRLLNFILWIRVHCRGIREQTFSWRLVSLYTDATRGVTKDRSFNFVQTVKVNQPGGLS